MNISEYALKNKSLIYFLVGVLVIGGIYSFITMSKLEDPAITVKQALIVTPFPGATSYEVELQVTDLLEKSIRTMGDLDHIESRSMNDVSEILVELKSTVPLAKLQENWDILRRKVYDVQTQLPQGARQSMVFDNFGDVYGIFYAMTSDGLSYDEMSKYAEYVRNEMLNIPEVSSVEIYGEHPSNVTVSINEDKMANLGVHPAEVLLTLNGQNSTVYSGYFNSGDKRIRVGVEGKFNDLDNMRNLLVKGHEGDLIKLSDIATIQKEVQSPVRQTVYNDSLPAIALSIAMHEGGNIIDLGKKVEKKLTELKEDIIPAGLEFEKVFYQPRRVQNAINVFMVNLIESVLIVIVVIMLAMGFKSGLTIGNGLIIIVLGSFLILNLMDGTLQRVSLGSFIVAMGMLVDNAIVIIDGIKVDMERGIPKPQCLTRITQKTAWPLLGATTIGILAFYPIYLSPDTTGEYVRDLFIVLAVSLWLSWILAVTYAPIQAERSFKIDPNKIEKDPFQGKFYDKFRGLLNFSLNHRSIIIGVTLIALVISVWGFKFVPQGFFPDLSYNQLYIEYKVPEGANPNYVEERIATLRDYLLDKEEITKVTSSYGGTPSRYNLVRTVAEPSLSYGEFIVDFTSPETLVKMIPNLQKDLSENFPEAYIRIKRYNLMYMNYPIQYQIMGPNPDTLRMLCQQVEEIMKNDSNVMLVTNNWGKKTLGFNVDYYQPSARDAGLTRQDVSLSLLASTDGLPIGTYYNSYNPWPITIKNVDINGTRLNQLNNVPVWSTMPNLTPFTGENLQLMMQGALSEEDLLHAMIGSIPLGQVTQGVDVVWETPVVRRYNGERAIAVQCNNAYGVTSTAARASLLPKIEKIEMPDGYSTMWQGEYLASNESKSYLFRYIPLAVALIITILILLFKDFKRPIMILCCLPLAIIGIVCGMLLANQQFGFVAIVGALGLIGMMIKNGVVLVDEIDLQIKDGEDPLSAVINGTTTRVRPVFLAALTTILGMIPLLTDEMFGSLAVTIMGGLFVGTVITLVILPILYTFFTGIKINHKTKEQ